MCVSQECEGGRVAAMVSRAYPHQAHVVANLHGQTHRHHHLLLMAMTSQPREGLEECDDSVCVCPCLSLRPQARRRLGASAILPSGGTPGAAPSPPPTYG